MRPHHYIAASLLLTILLAAPLIRADGGGGIRGEDDHNNGLRLQSGNLTAIFNGQKPSVRFFFNSDPRQEFFVKFNSLIEHNDTDGNMAFERNESVAFASLDASNWTHTNFTDTGDHVEISFTTLQVLIQPVGVGHQDDSIGSQGGHLASVNVTFVAKLFKTDVVRTITVGGDTFTIHGGAEIKVDILISHWPFLSAKDRLALRVDLHSEINDFEVHENDGEHEVKNSDAHQNDNDHGLNDHEAGGEGKINFIDSSQTIGGFFRFIASAKTDGTATPVVASFRFEPDEVSPLENEIKLFLSYHSFTNTLEHDPSFGIVPHAAAPFPSLLPLAVVSIALSAALVALTRRRKSL